MSKTIQKPLLTEYDTLVATRIFWYSENENTDPQRIYITEIDIPMKNIIYHEENVYIEWAGYERYRTTKLALFTGECIWVIAAREQISAVVAEYNLRNKISIPITVGKQ